MSSIIVAGILVLAIVAVTFFLVTLEKKNKQKLQNEMAEILSDFSIKYELSISRQEYLRNMIIGLDGINKKILVVFATKNNLFRHLLIDLCQVKNCQVKNYYSAANLGHSKEPKPAVYLERMVLEFEYNNKYPNEEIAFYDHIYNNSNQLAELEEKAKHWRTLANKLIGGGIRKIA
jgi:ribosomal protein S24E